MHNQLIIELLNCSKFYIVILDKKMNIKFINGTLAERLGFVTTQELIGRCWMDFIPEKDKENIKVVHFSIVYDDTSDYNEFLNDLECTDGSKFQVQWFNTLLNHDTNWTFSFGMPKNISDETSKEKIRENFRSRIESDKTMIRSLKKYVSEIQDESDPIDTCDMEV